MNAIEISMFWLGMPSKYNPDDKALSEFPDCDLGGRYMALPINRTPQQVFDTTIKPFQFFYKEAGKRAAMTGNLTPDIVFADAICMTWIFASQEISKINTRLDELERRLTKIEQADKGEK